MPMTIWVAAAIAFSIQAGGSRNLAEDPAVAKAVEAVRRIEAATIDEQVRLCEIPAPPFKERTRAEAYRQALEQLGLQDVRFDAVGNVIGVRPGASATPNVVLSAHLDTVFPEETDVRVKRTGARISGPGIGDNCRGLAVVLAVVRALYEAGVPTPGTLTIVATVGEEGPGH